MGRGLWDGSPEVRTRRGRGSSVTMGRSIDVGGLYWHPEVRTWTPTCVWAGCHFVAPPPRRYLGPVSGGDFSRDQGFLSGTGVTVLRRGSSSPPGLRVSSPATGSSWGGSVSTFGPESGTTSVHEGGRYRRLPSGSEGDGPPFPPFNRGPGQCSDLRGSLPLGEGSGRVCFPFPERVRLRGVPGPSLRLLCAWRGGGHAPPGPRPPLSVEYLGVVSTPDGQGRVWRGLPGCPRCYLWNPLES